MENARPADTRPGLCERCLKPTDLCVCAEIRPLANRIEVLILQHPQEPDKNLGSARLAHLALQNSALKVGLSWPNLRKALGREAQPSRWAVLHLGSGVKEAGGGKPRQLPPGLHFVTKQGVLLENQREIREDLEGIILLDGTWSQAKTLWWRNAWLLKLRRAILVPSRKSLYGELRREPRRECLSTIESAAEALDFLGEDKAVAENLRKTFAELLDRQRERLKRRRQTRDPGQGKAT